MINKKIKIITVNIILILFCFMSAEFYLCSKEYFRLFKETNLRNISLNKQIERFNFNKYYKFIKKEYSAIFNTKIKIPQGYFRKIPSYPNNIGTAAILPKKPILLFGCSFTWGEGLTEEEIFSTQLANKTNRIVYNLGLGARSPRTILYLLRENFKLTKKELLKDNLTFEYVIYTYFNDHKRRLYVNLRTDNIPYYKINKDNKLQFINYSFLRKTYLYKGLCELVFVFKNQNDEEEINNLFCLYMKEINNEIKSKFSYGNNKTKFVIFVYDNDNLIDWQELADEGIIIIKASDLGLDLNDKEYKLLDNHPNAKAWEVIVPALAKELNL